MRWQIRVTRSNNLHRINNNAMSVDDRRVPEM